MSRLVRVPREVPGAEGSGSNDDTQLSAYLADGYLERIAKYVPAEVLAFSIFINAILDQAVKTGGNLTAMAGVPVLTIAEIAFVACMIATPLFVWYVREKGDAWITNAIV